MPNKVTIRQRNRKDGTAALYLDIYYGANADVDANTGKLKYTPLRKRQTLDCYIYLSPKNKSERLHNKEAMALAEEMRRQEEILIASTVVLTQQDIPTDTDFYTFYEDYIEVYQKKDARHLKRALSLFREFLGTVRKYRHLTRKLSFNTINRQMIEGYTVFLQGKFKGEGPHTVYARFKKVFKNAVLEGVINRSPCDGVTISCSQGSLKKDTLTKEEINKLMSTHYHGENNEIRRAFLFCLFTGIRGCDVRNLTFENYCVADQTLRFDQQKTSGRSSASAVSIPMTRFHQELIGTIPLNKKALIFDLPSDTTCNKQLRLRMKEAEIYKHITWHCARHSFGTNLCEEGVNPMTIMGLMGHSSLKYTNVYVRVRDKSKIEAMNALCNPVSTV